MDSVVKRVQGVIWRLSHRARSQRGVLFRELLQTGSETRVLDLGGGTGDHVASIIPEADVTVADISPSQLAAARANYGFKTVTLDDSGKLPFDDGAFDIVFCSSVIEHATGPKHEVLALRDSSEFERVAREHQVAFANEIARVGRQYFVQTPARYFPIESHSWLPGLVAVLPRRAQVGVINIANRCWINETQPDWRLLTARDLAVLFPDAQIVRERFAGMTKSLMAVRSDRIADN